MVDGGHDHAHLVAGDDNQDDCKILPCDLGRRCPTVPEKNGEEVDEPEEMGPDVESLIVKRKYRSQTLAVLLWRTVPSSDVGICFPVIWSFVKL